MNSIHPIWRSVGDASVAVPIIDASNIYDRVYMQVRRTTYINPTTVAATVATIRTAWVFVAKVNELLPVHARVYVYDDARAIDSVDRCYEALTWYAQQFECDIHYRGWTVWSGKHNVIQEWRTNHE